MEYIHVKDITPDTEYWSTYVMPPDSVSYYKIDQASIIFTSIDTEAGTGTAIDKSIVANHVFRSVAKEYPIQKDKEGYWQIEVLIERRGQGQGDPYLGWKYLVIKTPPPPPDEEVVKAVEELMRRQAMLAELLPRIKAAKSKRATELGIELTEKESDQLNHDVITEFLIEEDILEKEKLRRNGAPVDIAALKEEIKPQVAFAVSEVNKCIQTLIQKWYKDIEISPPMYDHLRIICMEDVYSKMYKPVSPKGCGAGCSIAGGRTKKSKRSKRIKKWKRSTRRRCSL